MPFAAGHAKTPGSGRPPGAVNKRTQALWDQLAELGFRQGTEDDPLILMWMWMSGRKAVTRYLTVYSEGEEPVPIGEEKVLEPAADEVRMHLAKELAPYLYAKLKAIEHTGKDGKDLIPARVDYRKLAKAAGMPLAAPAASAAPAAAANATPPAPAAPQPAPRSPKRDGAPRP